MKKFFIWINQLNRLFWEKVVISTYSGTKSLSVFRIITGLFLLMAYMPSFGWIANMPKTFFSPPIFSIAIFFDTFPDKPFFFILDFLVFLSLVCLTLGVKARISSLIYLLACLVGLSFQYSFGKISHTILAYMLIGCMAFSGWGRHLSLLPDKKSRFDNTAKSLSLFSVLICFGMFTAGLQKAWHWVDFDLAYNGVLSWSQGSIFKDYKYHLFAPYFKHFPDFVIEFFDYTAVFFELSPLLFLLHSRRAWKIWLLMACIFHLANTLLLNIPFPLHVIVYLAFVDFRRLYQVLHHCLSLLYFKCIATGIMLLVIVIRCCPLIFDRSLVSIFWEPDEVILLNLYFSVGAWSTTIVLFVRSIWMKPLSRTMVN